MSFAQNLLLMPVSFHSSEGYWEPGKASALHQEQERHQTITDLCASAVMQLANKSAQHSMLPRTSAAHRE